MNILKTFRLSYFWLICIVFSITSSYSATSSDSLVSCVNTLMSPYFVYEYDLNLKKYLFTETDYVDTGNLIRYLILPSFSEEEYIAVYKIRNGSFRLEYSKPNTPIWYSLQSQKYPANLNNQKLLDEIRITTIRKQISKELFHSVARVWLEMVKNQIPVKPSDFKKLDGTIYYFSTSTLNCAMSRGSGDGNVKSIIEIGNMLKKYSSKNGASQKIENTIIEQADKLYTKITT